jgi:hypothetical protein
MKNVTTALAAVVLAGSWATALCDGPATQTQPAGGVVKVRVATRHQTGWWGVQVMAEDARTNKRLPWQTSFEFSDPRLTDRQQLADLVDGKYDLAVVILPLEGGPDPNTTVWSLRDKKYSVSLVGWRVLGAAVHPACPLEEIDRKTLRSVIEGSIRDWQGLTGKGGKLKLIQDNRAYQAQSMIGTASGWPAGRMEPEIPRVLQELADDPLSLGLMAVDERLASSGLKILPIREAGGKAAVAPSVQNVKDGTYPYFTCVAVVVRPDASQAARDFARILEGPLFADKLDTYEGWLTSLEYVLPGPGKATVSVGSAVAAPADLAGAVAVLPVENHSPYFLMARQEHLSAWEQAVTDGIAADKRLALVDRAKLKAVLDELKRTLASGSRPAGPMLSADILVAPSMDTLDARAWLSIRAFHVPTGSCLGEMRLPVDPARPEEFRPALAEQVRPWWTGVLGNLHAARTRPVWAVAPGSASTKPAAQGADLPRASLEASLAADSRVFLAQYIMMPEGQREKLMRLMGLARASGGRFAPAADFVVELAPSGARQRIRVLDGRDLREVASTEAPADQVADWLGRQVAVLGKAPSSRPAAERPADDASANRQAEMELRRGRELQAQYEKLRGEAFARYRAAGLSDYTDEDRKQLDSLHDAAQRSFERAVQLDPANEKSSRQSADAAWEKMGGRYDSMVKALERCRQHMESFPGAPGLRGMMERVISLEVNLARYLEEPGVRDSSVASVPRNLPEASLIKEYRRSALKHLAAYVERFIAVRDKRGGDSWESFGVITKTYGLTLDIYFRLSISLEEAEEVLAEYGRAADSYPDVLPPQDFRRLRYYAIKANQKAYVDLLAAMQKRWPNPADAHWTLGRDQALGDLCDLLQTDRRATNFYQWLRGKRGPGDLP